MTRLLFMPPEARITVGILRSASNDKAMARRLIAWSIGAAIGIDELSEDVPDRPGGAQMLRRHVAGQPVPDEERAPAEIADAEDRGIRRGDSLERLPEHVLRQDGRRATAAILRKSGPQGSGTARRPGWQGRSPSRRC